MIKEQKYILVLGSKPDSRLPDTKVEHIYSANGAAERAVEYKKKYPGIKHTALIGSKEFSENQNVKSRVITSRPYRLYCRSGSIDLPSELKDCKLEFLSSKEQLNFQSNDLVQFGKHIRAEYGLWARGATARAMGIDGSNGYMGLYTNTTEKYVLILMATLV